VRAMAKRATRAAEGGSSFVSWCSDASRYWYWLGRWLLGRRQLGDVIVDGVSLRQDGVFASVVVRGLRVTDMHRVVAFGRALHFQAALRNVTLAIERGQWRRDKYVTVPEAL